MSKRCENCGAIRKTVFTCKRCDKKICLDCYNFVMLLCKDCEVIEYNEKYQGKIDLYEQGLHEISI